MGRGMMKWAPYQSLTEQSTYITNLRKKEAKVERPHISSDIAEQINEVLVNYHGQDVKIKLFENGEIIEIICKINKIDPYNHCLIIGDNKLEFVNLLFIENI